MKLSTDEIRIALDALTVKAKTDDSFISQQLFQTEEEEEEITEAKAEFKIDFNGSNTYQIIDSNGDSWGYTNTKRKAINKMKKILKDTNKMDTLPSILKKAGLKEK